MGSKALMECDHELDRRFILFPSPFILLPGSLYTPSVRMLIIPQHYPWLYPIPLPGSVLNRDQHRPLTPMNGTLSINALLTTDFRNNVSISETPKRGLHFL
jgi:hypothetical protein